MALIWEWCLAAVRQWENSEAIHFTSFSQLVFVNPQQSFVWMIREQGKASVLPRALEEQQTHMFLN